MPTKPYALIDTDSGETIRYLDKRTAPPAGCKVIRTGYKPLTPYQKAVAIAGGCKINRFRFSCDQNSQAPPKKRGFCYTKSQQLTEK